MGLISPKNWVLHQKAHVLSIRRLWPDAPYRGDDKGLVINPALINIINSVVEIEEGLKLIEKVLNEPVKTDEQLEKEMVNA